MIVSAPFTIPHLSSQSVVIISNIKKTVFFAAVGRFLALINTHDNSHPAHKGKFRKTKRAVTDDSFTEQRNKDGERMHAIRIFSECGG